MFCRAKRGWLTDYRSQISLCHPLQCLSLFLMNFPLYEGIYPYCTHFGVETYACCFRYHCHFYSAVSNCTWSCLHSGSCHPCWRSQENVCTEAACAASRIAFVHIVTETRVRVATHKSCHFLQGSQQFVISLNCNSKTK